MPAPELVLTGFGRLAHGAGPLSVADVRAGWRVVVWACWQVLPVSQDCDNGHGLVRQVRAMLVDDAVSTFGSVSPAFMPGDQARPAGWLVESREEIGWPLNPPLPDARAAGCYNMQYNVLQLLNMHEAVLGMSVDLSILLSQAGHAWECVNAATAACVLFADSRGISCDGWVVCVHRALMQRQLMILHVTSSPRPAKQRVAFALLTPPLTREGLDE